MKQQRWYEIVDGIALVYDTPYIHNAVSVSIVPVKQLSYYRNNFKLSKVWG